MSHMWMRVFGTGDVNHSSTEVVRRFLRREIPAYVDGALNIVFSGTDVQDFGDFIAYASSTDNTTGDGWASIASADFSSSDLTSIGF